MERITKIRPAYDKRSDDPKKDFGIHCMQVFMVLKGKLGAVHFTWSTGIFLEETEKRLAKEGHLNWEKLGEDHYFSVAKAQGYDVGYHSLKPLNEYQKKEGPRWRMKLVKRKADDSGMTTMEKAANMRWKKLGKGPVVCEWLGKPCYCDGSAMRAEEWFNILKAEGSDKIWDMMEKEYKLLFGKK